jgi:hypothetical protein
MNAYKILLGEPEGKKPLGRHTRRWEDTIKMDLTGIGSEGVHWIHLAQDGNRCEHFNETSGSIKDVKFLDQVRFQGLLSMESVSV